MKKALKASLVLVVMALGVYALNSVVNGADDPTPADLKEIIQKAFDEAYLKGNVDALDEISSPDFVGLNAFKESVKSARLAFSECRNTIDELFVSGDRIIIQSTFKGTFANKTKSKWSFQNKETGKSETIGVSIPAGAKYTEKGCTVVRLVNNKAVEVSLYSDRLVPRLTAAGIELKIEPVEE